MGPSPFIFWLVTGLSTCVTGFGLILAFLCLLGMVFAVETGQSASGAAADVNCCCCCKLAKVADRRQWPCG